MFDGHGGREVAKYSEKHFPTILQADPHFAKLDYKEALRSSFMKVDQSLINGGLAEVAAMKR